jgi:hypothetical protein
VVEGVDFLLIDNFHCGGFLAHCLSV